METTAIINQEQLISERNYYRDQTRRLRKINDFYGKIVGIVDSTSLIEAYSIWLMQHVRFLLIGYANPARNRSHFICTQQEPNRRQVMTLAESIISDVDSTPAAYQQLNGLHTYAWMLDTKRENGGIILIKQDGRVQSDEAEIIEDSLQVMNEPIKKALDYEDTYLQARQDPLTQLPNRLVFEEEIQAIIEINHRRNKPLTIAAMDLDKFKQINDTKGHLEGDRVLQLVATTLKKQLRASDMLIRMGGDEFLLVLQGTDLEASHRICNRLCQAIEALDIRSKKNKVCLSIGLAQYRADLSLKQLVDHADNMLYLVKASGGNTVAG